MGAPCPHHCPKGTGGGLGGLGGLALLVGAVVLVAHGQALARGAGEALTVLAELAAAVAAVLFVASLAVAAVVIARRRTRPASSARPARTRAAVDRAEARTLPGRRASLPAPAPYRPPVVLYRRGAGDD